MCTNLALINVVVAASFGSCGDADRKLTRWGYS